MRSGYLIEKKNNDVHLPSVQIYNNNNKSTKKNPKKIKHQQTQVKPLNLASQIIRTRESN
jgi:hypothetical protein